MSEIPGSSEGNKWAIIREGNAGVYYRNDFKVESDALRFAVRMHMENYRVTIVDPYGKTMRIAN